MQMHTDNDWLIFAVFFAAMFWALACVAGCVERQWSTNPEEHLTPDVNSVRSIETATIGVRVEK